MTQTDILIIGGGAAGLSAALAAAKAAPKARVTVAERLPRTGKKLLATGNGRCNIMNTLAAPRMYKGDAEFISPALDAYKKNCEEFWASLGLTLRLEDEGRVYPECSQASAVLDVLRLGLQKYGIDELTDTEIKSIKPGFVCGDIRARKVIVATGSLAGKGLGENSSFETLLKPLGHRITPVYPALTQLLVPEKCIAGLKGLRFKGSAALYEDDRLLRREEGEILFGDGALSGIACMQLTLEAAGKKRLTAVLGVLGEDAEEMLFARRAALKERPVSEFLTGAVNKRIALLALKRAGFAGMDKRVYELTGGEIKRLASELSHWKLPVLGTGDFKNAQVMLGGADTRDFDRLTLESKLVKGLYACGEALDVTGPCGGYNLEWAWAGGMLAGEKAGQSL